MEGTRTVNYDGGNTKSSDRSVGSELTGEVVEQFSEGTHLNVRVATGGADECDFIDGLQRSTQQRCEVLTISIPETEEAAQEVFDLLGVPAVTSWDVQEFQTLTRAVGKRGVGQSMQT